MAAILVHSTPPTFSSSVCTIRSANKLNYHNPNYLLLSKSISSIRSKNSLFVKLPVSYNNNNNSNNNNNNVKTGANIIIEQPDVSFLIFEVEKPIFTPPKHGLKKQDFPPDFIFGASTSAIQTEGNGKEGGRGPSTWDFMIKADEGKKAVDSYNLYKEDVKLLKKMGMNTYRFSVAWPRILPNGTVEGGINQEGIDFYNNFIDELLANGITPFIALFHFDLPVPLQEKFYGFMRPNIIEHFKEFADVCFEKFGDRVKYWGTINEPYVFGSYGYKVGLPDDDLKDDPLGPYIATHNIILAHAAAAKLYKQKYQKSQGGKIGISLPCKWYVPHPGNPKGFAATKVQLGFSLGWYMDPLTRGEYPESMRTNVKGLPEFTKSEKEMVKGAFDYIGINYYTSRFVQHNFTFDPMAGQITIKYSDQIADNEGNLIGWQAKGQDGIYVHPDGLKNLLLYVKTEYGNPEVYVTENGVPDKPTITDEVHFLLAKENNDELEAIFFYDYRIQHVEDHLIAVREARKEGANVKGYIVWSLMDNMEVGAGYDVRFGFNYTDYYNNHNRYPKKSAKWFSNFLGVKDGAKSADN